MASKADEDGDIPSSRAETPSQSKVRSMTRALSPGIAGLPPGQTLAGFWPRTWIRSLTLNCPPCLSCPHQYNQSSPHVLTLSFNRNYRKYKHRDDRGDILLKRKGNGARVRWCMPVVPALRSLKKGLQFWGRPQLQIKFILGLFRVSSLKQTYQRTKRKILSLNVAFPWILYIYSPISCLACARP